jgi:polysaccharide biosynthesis transport protein
MSRLYEALTKAENGGPSVPPIDVVGGPSARTNGIPSGQRDRVEQPQVLRRYVEPMRLEGGAPTPDYDRLRDYRVALIRKKMTLLWFAAAGVAAAILLSLVQTPLYRARTSLEVQNFNENFLDMKGMDPTSPSTDPSPTGDTYLGTQIQIMQSESLIERVIDKLNMQQARPATHRWAIATRARHILGFPTASPLQDKQELIRQAEANLTVRSAANTRLMQVFYESPDPKLAADFANTLVSEFVQQSQDIRWKSTQRTGEWLTGHLDEMKTKLERSEVELQDYARTTGLTFTSDKDNVAAAQLKQLQDEFSASQADSIAKQAKFEEAENKPVESLSVDDAALRDYNQKLNDLQGHLAELSATLTPAHYKVQRVQAQIAQLQLAVQKERDQILRRISNDYEAARRREKLLAKAYAEQERIVADKSSKAIHYETLKGNVDSNRQIYESMLQRVKQAELASAMRASNVLVIDTAKPPVFPYKPNLTINSAFGLLSGMFVGVAFVLVWRHYDHRILAPGEAQILLNLPELGVIPTAQIASAASQQPALTTTSSFGDSPELATWESKVSLLAESFRSTLTSILLPVQNGDHPQVVLLTSPVSGDGKTTVASNLAIAMAEMGRKVVLIDGDVRRPRLHRVFGISNDWGLADVLSEKTPASTIPLTKLARETRIPGLYLLPSGTKTMTTCSLFHSPGMTMLLGRLRTEFDMILIDAPPVISLADARVLGRIADGVVLVLRAGRTTLESALFASQRFAEDGTRVLGTVLNSWDPQNNQGYYTYKEYSRTYGSTGK